MVTRNVHTPTQVDNGVNSCIIFWSLQMYKHPSKLTMVLTRAYFLVIRNVHTLTQLSAKLTQE